MESKSKNKINNIKNEIKQIEKQTIKHYIRQRHRPNKSKNIKLFVKGSDRFVILGNILMLIRIPWKCCVKTEHKNWKFFGNAFTSTIDHCSA